MTTSASGARIQGDDYQHLFAWYHALRLLAPQWGVVSVEVESAGAGNVDDVVVRRTGEPDEYVQVKYSVDASKPISSEWFTTPISEKGQSPLQRFASSWRQLNRNGATPQLTLFTNRVLDPTDPLLKLRSGLRATLGERLQDVAPGSLAGKQLAAWAKHAGLTKGEMIELLSSLAIKTDQGAWTGLVDAVCDRMGFVGLASTAIDAESGVAAIRSWVKTGVRSLDRSALETEVERRRLRANRRYATLLVQAIDHAPWPDAAQARVDWVSLFRGDEPRARRQLHDPAGWANQLRPELIAAARSLSTAGETRILVRGYMRLPLWFLCGAELPDTRGHHVACLQRGQLWTSEEAAASYALAEKTTDLGKGNEIAIGLSVTNSIGVDVCAYCTQSALPVSKYIDLSPAAGVGANAIPDGAAGLGWARAVRDAVRSAVRSHGSRRVHLFMSGPAGGALLLGHAWNRVGPTVVYEDLSPGYAPTFEIPG